MVMLTLMTACGSYKQSIMFKVSDTTPVKQQADVVVKNYILTKNDRIRLRVYTKNGERIVDPDNYLRMGEQIQQQGQQRSPKDEEFFLDQQGVVKLPMLGEFKLEGSTIREAELILQKEFAKFYEDVFVVLECLTRRVIILGAPGGQVLPLVNENTSLAEVIAMSKGLPVEGKVQNIRLLRNNEVFLADFSTVEGFQRSNYTVQSGDIVYIEPVRRPLAEGLRDYGSLISIAASLIAVIVAVTATQN
jgi:polysaccharide biosynthesis/export protein